MVNWQENFLKIIKNYHNIVFSTSFSIEDQIILDFIVKNNLEIEIFTIDTGRLPDETYQIWQKNLEKYQTTIKVFYPDQDEISDYVEKNGINAFYKSVELRKKCCEIRKVLPLKQALNNKDLWLSGVRKEHSLNRSDKTILEYDENLKIDKFYPLFELTTTELEEIVEQENIDLNQLYYQGYKSIGCRPCSRAINKFQNFRAGRWWWEDEDKKECGLHGLNAKK